MTQLVAGPMLRHVSATSATVWVETDAPCSVEVLGTSTRTFTVHDHHYALVVIEGLAPGTVAPYEVALDGVRGWPEAGSDLPPSCIRTLGGPEPLSLVFGSCRTAAPHEPPWNLELDKDERGRGVDALYAHTLRMIGQEPSAWPHLAVFLGDQVYADDASPRTWSASASGAAGPTPTRTPSRTTTSTGSRSTPGSTTSRGRPDRAVVLLGRAERDDLRRPRHDRRLEHLGRLARGDPHATVVGRARRAAG